MNGHLVASLAALKANWDTLGKDYIDNFVPFVIEAIRSSTAAESALSDIQASVNEQFGLYLPQGALATILKRSVRTGHVVVREGVYSVGPKDPFSFDFVTERDKAVDQYREILARFRAYAAARFDRELESAHAETLFARFLERYSIPFLRAAIDGQPLSALSLLDPEDYVFYSFVDHLFSEDDECFTFLVTIAKGSMLASTVLFPAIGDSTRLFRGTRFYFDTRIVLRALGYAGSWLEAPNRELLELLHAAGASLRCFQTTVKEIRGVLWANARDLRLGGQLAFGESFEFFQSNGYSSSDVLLLSNRLETDLEALRIRVDSQPLPSPELTLDEVRFEAILQEQVGYYNTDALMHDLNVATAIYRLRDGRLPYQLEDSKATFITTNSAFIRATLDYMVETFGDEAKQAPLSISDHHVGTIAWLKRPAQFPNLPRDRIIADCYVALNPPDATWRRYLLEIDKLEEQDAVTAEDYHLLRYSIEAQRALMDTTYGEPGKIDNEVIESILERSKQSIRREAEIKRERAEVETARAKEALEAAKVQIGAVQAGVALEMLRTQSETESAVRAEVRNAIKARSNRWAHRIALALASVVGALLLVAAILALPEPVPDFSWLPPFVEFVLLMIFVIYIVLNLVRGDTVRDHMRRVETMLSRWIETQLTRLVVTAPDSKWQA